MLLDIYTLQVTNALVAFASVIILVALRLTKLSPLAVSHWLLGMILLAPGMLLLGLRGVLPLFWSGFIACICIVAGLQLINRGVHHFLKHPPRNKIDPGLFGLFLVSFATFTFVYPHEAARITTVSLVLIPLCLDIAWVLYREKEADWRMAGIAVAATFMILAAALLARLLFVFSTFNNYSAFADGAAGPFFLACILVIGAITMTLTFLCLSELSAKYQLFAKAIDHCSSSVIITDSKGRITYINPGFEAKTGECLDSILSSTEPYKFGEMSEQERAAMWEDLASGKDWRGELQTNGTEGSLRWEVTTISPIRRRDGTVSHLVALQEDITARKEAEEEVRQYAYHDALTGLPSLRLAKDRLTTACMMARRTNTLVSVMFIDLDGFKQINDTHGHDSGDELLIEVSNRMQTIIRDTDTVARIGGDEFLVILGNLKDSQDVDRVANAIIELVSKPVRLKNGKIVTVGTSIGIAFYPTHGNNPEEVMKSADTAMYSVKKNGKNDFQTAA